MSKYVGGQKSNNNNKKCLNKNGHETCLHLHSLISNCEPEKVGGDRVQQEQQQKTPETKNLATWSASSQEM